MELTLLLLVVLVLTLINGILLFLILCSWRSVRERLRAMVHHPEQRAHESSRQYADMEEDASSTQTRRRPPSSSSLPSALSKEVAATTTATTHNDSNNDDDDDDDNALAVASSFCLICMDATPNALFHPCQHAACEHCSRRIMQTTRSAGCPFCRSSIASIEIKNIV